MCITAEFQTYNKNVDISIERRFEFKEYSLIIYGTTDDDDSTYEDDDRVRVVLTVCKRYYLYIWRHS